MRLQSLLIAALAVAVASGIPAIPQKEYRHTPEYKPPENLKPKKATKGWHKKNQRKQKGKRK